VKTDLTDLTNSVKIFEKQSIESENQPIELTLIAKSVNFNFFKSFSQQLSVKQPIETLKQQVVFHYIEKHFFFERC